MTYATGNGAEVSVQCPSADAPCTVQPVRRWLGEAARGAAALGLLGVFGFLSLAAALLFTLLYAVGALIMALINVGRVLIGSPWPS